MLIREFLFGLLPVFYFISSCHGQRLETNFSSYPNSGICGSVNIIGNPGALARLQNCSVIDGYLKIVLLDHATDLSNYTFPNLREITEYFIMYRVISIKSLGDMFPNLALIRGQSLFLNYALVLYDLPGLYEINLRSLTTISRGYVRIDDNSQLCYSQTVSWELITGRAKGHHFSNNGDHVCPGSDACRGCDDNLCWNSKRCQRIIKDNCHPECIGCPSKQGLCYRCKNYNDNGLCVKTCENGKVAHVSSHHCVTLDSCKKMYYGKGWAWNNTCIYKCPTAHKEVVENGIKTCVFCGDTCNRVCRGYEITSYADAQYFKGCNIINGSLEIQFMDNNHEEDVMQELEDSLGHVQEITGYLKVYRTPSVTSFKFLKNLTTIRGEILLHQKYAIAVNEMPNLEYLWGKSQQINILNGSLFFHYNAKLCLDDIKKLGNVTNSSYTREDVCDASNGYAARCRRELMEVSSAVLGSKVANITWKRIVQDYKQEFQMEYAIFYLEEPEIDVVTHNARDTCYSKDWNFLALSEFENYPYPTHTVTLRNLKPYTKYAYYVETAYRNFSVPVNSYREGRSEIMYFVTNMERPPMPVDIEAFSNTSDSMILFWNDPPSYRGLVSHYLFEITISIDDKHILDGRDYCISPPIREVATGLPTMTEKPVEYNDFVREMMVRQNCTCKNDFNKMIQDLIPPNVIENPLNTENCIESGRKGPMNEMEYHERLKCSNISFTVVEDTSDESKHARHERDNQMPFDIHKIVNPETPPGLPLNNLTIDDVLYTYSTNFPGNYKNHTVYNLKHYTKYFIAIAACKGPNNDDDCGSFALFAFRTMKNNTADTISNFTLVVLNNTHAELEWKEPVKPNGAILTYNIEYTMIDDKTFNPIVYCITRKMHEDNNGKFVIRINPGKYGIRIRATSLAMTGEYTKMSVYTYESSTNYAWAYAFFGLAFSIGIVWFALVMWKKRTRVFHFRDTVAAFQNMGIRWTSTDEGRVDLLHNFRNDQ